MKKNFTVFDLLSYNLLDNVTLDLQCLGGREGLENPIMETVINRPGLALCGFFENFGGNRIQVFGQGEMAYLHMLAEEEALFRLTDFFSQKIPCCVFTYGLEPSPLFLELSEEARIPVLQTALSSNDFQSRLFFVLNNVFALAKSLHGTLLEVYGLGLLIIGESGVGKSEAALELIERGHKLIADDSVLIKKLNSSYLRGLAPNRLNKRYQMEIRGLGIIDVASLFGKRAVRTSKRIDLVIQLENFDADKQYARTGEQRDFFEILEVKVPKIQVFMKPGRNVPIIIEAAVLSERDRLDQSIMQIDGTSFF